MKISTKGRYSLAILSDIAIYGNNKYVSLKTISDRLEISFKYLEKVIGILVKNNYLKVSRGKQGGYKLIMKPEEYKIGEILELTEKNMETIECISNPESCEFNTKCKRQLVWKGLDEVISKYLNNITLKDII